MVLVPTSRPPISRRYTTPAGPRRSAVLQWIRGASKVKSDPRENARHPYYTQSQSLITGEGVEEVTSTRDEEIVPPPEEEINGILNRQRVRPTTGPHEPVGLARLFHKAALLCGARNRQPAQQLKVGSPRLPARPRQRGTSVATPLPSTPEAPKALQTGSSVPQRRSGPGRATRPPTLLHVLHQHIHNGQSATRDGPALADHRTWRLAIPANSDCTAPRS